MDVRILNQAGDRLVNLIDKDIAIVKIREYFVVVAIKDDKSVEIAKYDTEEKAKNKLKSIIEIIQRNCSSNDIIIKTE